MSFYWTGRVRVRIYSMIYKHIPIFKVGVVCSGKGVKKDYWTNKILAQCSNKVLLTTLYPWRFVGVWNQQ